MDYCKIWKKNLDNEKGKRKLGRNGFIKHPRVFFISKRKLEIFLKYKQGMKWNDIKSSDS